MLDPYEKLLERALEKAPKVVTSGERFQLPPPEVLQEGKTTVVRNFSDLLDRMNRPSEHVVPTLLRELGVAGTYESSSGRLILQGRLSESLIEERISRYVETYVICGECGRPDTHLVREERTLILRCDACGGHRPVKSSRKISS